jgi:hypothetical protein
MSQELDSLRDRIIKNINGLEEKIKKYWKPEDITMYKSIHISELSTYKHILSMPEIERRSPKFRRKDD